MASDDNGCGVCEWEGDVAVTNDSSHVYYTHVIVRDGEMFKGKTCSRRTKPKSGGPLSFVDDLF